jgi:hypothetical protein
VIKVLLSALLIIVVASMALGLSPFCEEHDGGDVAAFVFLQVALAVAAEFARVVFCYGVRAVVAYDVVDACG